MSMFKHEAKQFKFDVLREVAKRQFEDRLEGDVANDIAHLLIRNGGERFRCCSYKERAVIRRRVRLAMGDFPNMGYNESQNKKQIVRVLEPACDGCSIQSIVVTNNCRKCMEKACMSACRFNAITMGEHTAYIDYKKCKECGACVKDCPYHAIIKTERPCSSACPVDAISWNDYGIAKIDEEKCINCGQCQDECPFGAISDLSWMTDVIADIKNPDQKIIATFAPALQGQFDHTTLPQLKQSLINLGFDKVYEVAYGADVVAYAEHQELLENMEKGIPMTTSCCPAFANLARIHFPEVYEKNMSTLVSPMIALARLLKKKYPDHKIVFIGPCVAKKQEAQQDGSCVDYVLSAEEIVAMLIARHIYPAEIEVEEGQFPSAHGRLFAQGGGVSGAVLQAHKEANLTQPVKVLYSDGCKECKKNLLLMKLGRLDVNIMEGMSCTGGCINGPVTFESAAKTKQRMNAENKTNDKTIHQSLEEFSFEGIDLHRHH